MYNRSSRIRLMSVFSTFILILSVALSSFSKGTQYRATHIVDTYTEELPPLTVQEMMNILVRFSKDVRKEDLNNLTYSEAQMVMTLATAEEREDAYIFHENDPKQEKMGTDVVIVKKDGRAISMSDYAATSVAEGKSKKIKF